jgi:hypothetical protein
VRHGVALLAWLSLGAGCTPAPPAAEPANSFAFAVFGDGPYRYWEEGRFRRVIADVNASGVQWLIHVGDLIWYPCSDAALSERLAWLNTFEVPVIYTPGDNEWTDCHESIAGRFAPLGRLRFLRETYFTEPRRSLGVRQIALETQSADSAWGEFVENARWRFGGFLFSTIHIVGSGNATETYPGRTPAEDAEARRRTAAALVWIDSAFAIARRDSMRGVVLAMHGDPGVESPAAPESGIPEVVQRMSRHAAAFPGPVLLIHGDDHTFRVDRPFRAPDGRVLENFTRLETMGAPDIGWVRVIVDSAAGRIIGYEPRVMPRRLIW